MYFKKLRWFFLEYHFLQHVFRVKLLNFYSTSNFLLKIYSEINWIFLQIVLLYLYIIFNLDINSDFNEYI